MSNFVGLRKLTVQDQARGVSFPTLVFYPTQSPPKSVSFGPYSLEVSVDAPASEAGTSASSQVGRLRPGRRLPLVVMSHGDGSVPFVNHDLFMALAQSGFVVGLPEHPGNNRHDNSLTGTLENLERRPHHLHLAVDAIASDPLLANHVNASGFAVVGHSMGGYAALAIAGGQPRWSPEVKVAVESDKRVKALVLMAPATSWYVPGDSLQEVKAPILLLAAEYDQVTPLWQSQLILDLIPNREQVTYQVVKNAGHCSFLTPFPAALQHLPAAKDPPGFDRVAFQRRLAEEVRLFLENNL